MLSYDFYSGTYALLPQIAHSCILDSVHRSFCIVVGNVNVFDINQKALHPPDQYFIAIVCRPFSTSHGIQTQLQINKCFWGTNAEKETKSELFTSRLTEHFSQGICGLLGKHRRIEQEPDATNVHGKYSVILTALRHLLIRARLYNIVICLWSALLV